MDKNTIAKKSGLIAGVGMIAYFLLFYAMDKELMLGMFVSYSSLAILFAAVLYAVRQHRAENGNVLTFKKGLRSGFLVVVIGNSLFYLFFFLLVKFDPELVTILKQQSIEFWTGYLETDQQREELIESYKDFNFGVSDVLTALAKSIIGGFFLALLGAALFKRDASL